MNDLELESKLKSVRVPERTEEYWDDFPSRVRVQLPRTVAPERARARWMPQWAWNSSWALACLTFCLVFWPVLKNERALYRQAARMPNQLRLLMADEHGMQYLVAERP